MHDDGGTKNMKEKLCVVDVTFISKVWGLRFEQKNNNFKNMFVGLNNIQLKFEIFLYRSCKPDFQGIASPQQK